MWLITKGGVLAIHYMCNSRYIHLASAQQQIGGYVMCSFKVHPCKECENFSTYFMMVTVLYTNNCRVGIVGYLLLAWCGVNLWFFIYKVITRVGRQRRWLSVFVFAVMLLLAGGNDITWGGGGGGSRSRCSAEGAADCPAGCTVNYFCCWETDSVLSSSLRWWTNQCYLIPRALLLHFCVLIPCW